MDRTVSTHPDYFRSIDGLLEQGFHILVVSALLHVDPRIVRNRCRSRTAVKTKAKFSRVPSMSTLVRDSMKWREVGLLVGAYLTVAENPYGSIDASTLIAATRIYQNIHLSIYGGLPQEHMLEGNAAFSIAREYRDGMLKYVSCNSCRIKFAHLLRNTTTAGQYKCPVCNTKNPR